MVDGSRILHLMSWFRLVLLCRYAGATVEKFSDESVLIVCDGISIPESARHAYGIGECIFSAVRQLDCCRDVLVVHFDRSVVLSQSVEGILCRLDSRIHSFASSAYRTTEDHHSAFHPSVCVLFHAWCSIRVRVGFLVFH